MLSKTTSGRSQIFIFSGEFWRSNGIFFLRLIASSPLGGDAPKCFWIKKHGQFVSISIGLVQGTCFPATPYIDLYSMVTMVLMSDFPKSPIHCQPCFSASTCYPLVNIHENVGKWPSLLGKLTISMAIFHGKLSFRKTGQLCETS